MPHDDGMLPAGLPVMTASGTGVGCKGSLCHSFREHRPLTCQEELLARCGFPISRLNIRLFKDSELLRLARIALPLPTPAATLSPIVAFAGESPSSHIGKPMPNELTKKVAAKADSSST